MSEWLNRVVNHPFNSSLATIDGLLSEVEAIAEQDIDALEDYNRLHLIYRHVSAKFELVDPIIIPLGTLTNLYAITQQIINELKNFINTKNRTHLVNANNQADNLLIHANGLPVIYSVKDVEGLREAVISYRKSATQHIHHLAESFGKIEVELKQSSVKNQEQLQQFSEKLQELTTEINTQKGRLDTAITQYQEQFSTAEQNREQRFVHSETKRSEQYSETASKREQEYSEEVKFHQDNYDKLLEESRNKLAQLEVEHKESSEAYLKQLESYKAHAEKLVHVIGNTGMVGGYQKVANAERKVALWWHLGAFFAMCGLIGFAIYASAHTLKAEFSWGIFGARIFVAAAFGILGAYSASQGNKHHQAERVNRRMELELASIDPYLVGLPKETQDKVKEQLAERLFGQGEPTPEIKDTKTTGSALDIAKMALETIQEISKKG